MNHRRLCAFGPGFYRIVLQNGARRYCQNEAEVEFVHSLLLAASVRRVQRDAYCLDGTEPDGRQDTRGVIDAETWLALPEDEGKRELGLVTDADYTRAYRAVEDAVLEMDRAAAEYGVRVPVMLKRPGTIVRDVSLSPLEEA